MLLQAELSFLQQLANPFEPVTYKKYISLDNIGQPVLSWFMKSAPQPLRHDLLA
jgi:hypothetical protein